MACEHQQNKIYPFNCLLCTCAIISYIVVRLDYLFLWNMWYLLFVHHLLEGRVTNAELFSHSGKMTIHNIKWWLGHVYHIPDECFLKDFLYERLANCSINIWYSQLWYKHTCKWDLKMFAISTIGGLLGASTQIQVYGQSTWIKSDGRCIRDKEQNFISKNLIL